jgi:type IV pilus assembly protein PilA
MQKLRERMAKSEEGFTLIELLVVMLIIGILAAIAIPSFFDQREKAQDADAKAVARTAQTAMETFATDSGGSYNGADQADLLLIEPTLADAEGLTAAGTATGYTVTATSETDREFSIVKDANTFSYPCDPDGGGCPGGDWSGD